MASRFPTRSVLVLLAIAIQPGVHATTPEPADHSMTRFLAQDDEAHAYRATRRLEARNGMREGWAEVVTEFSPGVGFQYEITSEGGSSYIRASVLRAVLDREREVTAHGASSALALSNYRFQANGVDADGLVNILLAPRRQEPVLVAGTMFLRPGDGELVRVQGRLARSPSFWVKNVDIVRQYDRIDGVVLPVALHAQALLRVFGPATLGMTYTYLEVDGHPVPSQRSGIQ